jgi:peptidoglycan biosynthesis protein MviN/MurJ (putative lipid II flippase)
LSFALSRRVDIGDRAEWVSYLARCGLAAVLCGVVAWGIDHWVEVTFHQTIIAAVGLAVAVGAGVLTYFVAARVLRLSESAQAWRMIRRRLPGGARA